MADFEAAFQKIILIEGGYSNRMADAGGETNWGITWATARLNGYLGVMGKMPLQTAKDIYRKSFWNKIRGDEIEADEIANKVFDVAVNCGFPRSIKFLQRILNVFNRSGQDWNDIAEDGKVGPQTISTLNLACKSRTRRHNILKGLLCLQGYHYILLAENKDRQDELNINGWFAQRIKF